MQQGNRRLPLIIALAGFVLYALTMGGGTTANSLGTVARLAGWQNIPLAGQPLLWLTTLPLHLLPEAWLAPAVKGLAAAVAALLLGLLARTLQLLPWDRPWDGASRWTMTLPVLTGCALCGLEFSFWQNATSECGELLALLPLAAAGWLLLEFKARQKRRWLEASVVVWGAGMAENWILILALPLFAAIIIRLTRRRFFNWKFILRLAGLGLAGFSLYAVPPLANGLAPHSPWTWGQAWMTSLHLTKLGLLLPREFWRANRLLTLVAGIYFLLPLLLLLVRMNDQGTSNKSGVDRFQIWLQRGLRLLLLLVCFWLALDPRVGPRQIIAERMNVWCPMLTFDYLNALGAAFLLGNLLLIAQPESGGANRPSPLSSPGLPSAINPARESRRSRKKNFWKPLVAPTAILLVLATVAGLLVRNAAAIVHQNTHALDEFGTLALASLPAGGGVVLCDFPDKLLAFQAGLARGQATAEWLAVDTRALPTAAYRAQLERRRPTGWVTDQNRHLLNPMETAALLRQVARTNRLFYLHPSYGIFFESFYLEPLGSVFEMKARGNAPLDPPPLTEARVTANEQFWTGVWNRNLAALAASAPHRSGSVAKQFRRFALTPAPRTQDRFLAQWYSLALDDWGNRLQTAGRLAAARTRLGQSLELNTNNVAARFSLICNTNLATTNRMGLDAAAKVADELQRPDRLNAFINANGPFDDPTFAFLQGLSFLDQGLLVQAAERLERVRTLAADSVAPELALAEIYNRLHLIDRSRPLINHLRQVSDRMPENRNFDLNLALLDSYAWAQETNLANARDALQSLVEQHPDDSQINNRALAAYVAFGDISNALQLADAQLARNPDDVTVLNNKAMILLQSARGTEAVALLDRVLSLTNLAAARMNRAYAGMASTNYALAESDLRQLEQEGNGSPMVSFGLASVAEHHHDTNQAVWYLKSCLSNSPPNSPLAKQAGARLRALAAPAAARD